MIVYSDQVHLIYKSDKKHHKKDIKVVFNNQNWYSALYVLDYKVETTGK